MNRSKLYKRRTDRPWLSQLFADAAFPALALAIAVSQVNIVHHEKDALRQLRSESNEVQVDDVFGRGAPIFWETIVFLILTLLVLAAFSETTFSLGGAMALACQGFAVTLLVGLVFIYDRPFKVKRTLSPKPIINAIAFVCELLKLLKVLPKIMDLAPALRDQISQSSEQEITFGTEALSLAFVGYPLITKDLEHLADLLKQLPSTCQATRRLCSLWLRRSWISIYMFKRTCFCSKSQKSPRVLFLTSVISQ